LIAIGFDTGLIAIGFDTGLIAIGFDMDFVTGGGGIMTTRDDVGAVIGDSNGIATVRLLLAIQTCAHLIGR
jgi:hypothetical protein